MAPSSRKKAVPIETTISLTPILFFLLLLVIGGLVYLLTFYQRVTYSMMTGISGPTFLNTGVTSTPLAAPLFPIASRTTDIFTDPYAPPLKNDIFMSSQMPTLIDVRGPPIAAVPVNIPSRGYDTPYTQIGILNRADGSGDLILPLMGKQATTARDKYNYYTISNTGSVNTKLPVKVKGKSGVSEYGCDEIMSGDTVHVDGYNAPFRTTIYENNTFRYLPVL
jgi:Family of unknown function (DUF5755)